MVRNTDLKQTTAVEQDSIIVEGWTLPLDVDQIIWSQGADPAVMRRRRPKVVRIAEEVMENEVQYLKPQLLYRRIPVTGFLHDRLQLADGGILKGEVFTKHLAGADEIIVAIFTVGAGLDERLAQTMQDCLPYALALDALGTAAVDELGRQVQEHFKTFAQTEEKHLSMCFSPGMIGWPLEQGQPQVFSLLDAGSIGVSVADSGRMTPRKTISAVYGLGSSLPEEVSSPCDFCAVRDTCQYRGRHEDFENVQH